MKYYVTEKIYNAKNRLIKDERLTGDTDYLSWAKQQMDYRFQQIIQEKKYEIQNGGVFCREDECKIVLKNDETIVISIKKLNYKSNASGIIETLRI